MSEETKNNQTESLEDKTAIMPPVMQEKDDKKADTVSKTQYPNVVYSVENTSKKLKKERRKKKKIEKASDFNPSVEENQSIFEDQKTQFIDTRGIDVATTPISSSNSADTKETGDNTEEIKSNGAAETSDEKYNALSKRALGGTIIAIVSVILLVCTCMFGGPLLYTKGYTNGVKDGKEVASTQTSSASSSTKSDNSETKSTDKSATENQECKHQWQDVSEVVHHDAVTHEVNHPAEYEQRTVTHTVCNICGSKIDNIIDQHKKDTGHYSWTSDVPFQESVMTKGEYTETVVDKEAYDEVVVNNQVCNLCGETRSKS